MSGKASDSSNSDMTYGDYLCLDALLSAQQPKSAAHDEMLFIIQHQTSELWMQLALYELAAARTRLIDGDLPSVFKMLARVSRIFEQLNNAWDVLRTMTPSEYTQFRDGLATSSGFQSWQYRQIEFILGNRNPQMLRVHTANISAHDELGAELQRPSLYDEAVALLFRTLGDESELPAPQLQQAHKSVPAIQAHWKRVYENTTQYWSLYELAEKLVDLEDYFRRWRFNHVTTVERIIGFKRGTGGTSGVAYLRQMLAVELFPELWRVRGEL